MTNAQKERRQKYSYRYIPVLFGSRCTCPEGYGEGEGQEGYSYLPLPEPVVENNFIRRIISVITMNGIVNLSQNSEDYNYEEEKKQYFLSSRHLTSKLTRYGPTVKSFLIEATTED